MRRILSTAAVMLGLGVTQSAQPLAAQVPLTPGISPGPAPTATDIVTAPITSSPSYIADVDSRPWNETAAISYDPRFWLSVDYLVWGTRNQATQQLITSVAAEAINSTAANLPAGSVRDLYPSNRKIEFNSQSGIRVTGGFTTRNGVGVDVSAFALSSVSDGAFLTSSGTPSLARVYFRAIDNTGQNLYSALPGQYGGSVRVFADTQTFGADTNLRWDWYKLIVDRNELLTGVRFVQVEESLLINDRADLSGGTVVNTVLDVARTRNRYYGAQVGLASRLVNARGVSLEVVGKLGIGSVRQEAQLFGKNTLTGEPDQDIGLYVSNFNRGRFVRDQFAGAGELGINLGYNFTPNARVVIGYNIIWLSSVVRPGQAFDQSVNDSTLRYVAQPLEDNRNRRPNFDFGRSASDFWVQGLNLGLTLSY